MDDIHEHIEEVFGDVQFERSRRNVAPWGEGYRIVDFARLDELTKRTTAQAYKKRTYEQLYLCDLKRQRARGIGPTKKCQCCGAEFKTRPPATTAGRQKDYCTPRCQNRAAYLRKRAKKASAT